MRFGKDIYGLWKLFWAKFSEAFGRNFRRFLAEIFGGFWPKFSEAILGEILGIAGQVFKYIYNFDQVFKVISSERIQEWINLTIYSKLF